VRPEELPLPVAMPAARLEAALDDADRIAAGADATEAAVKYVALVRLAEWREAHAPREEKVLEAVGRVLASPSLQKWHRVAAAVQGSKVLLQTPLLRDWKLLDGKPGLPVPVADEARLYRHSRLRPDADQGQAANIVQAFRRICEVAEPILRIPLVLQNASGTHPLVGPLEPAGQAPGSIGLVLEGRLLELDPFALLLEGRQTRPVEGPPRHDLHVYEHLVGERVFYEFERRIDGATQRGLREEELPARLRDLLEGVRAGKRASLVEAAGALAGPGGIDKLRQALVDSFRSVARRMRTLPHVARPAVIAATATPGREIDVMALTGPSGVGKTREAIEWLEREVDAGRLPLLVRASVWKDHSLFEQIGLAALGVPASIEPPTIREAARERGLCVAIDGVNETSDPRRLLKILLEDLRAIAGTEVSVRVLITTRPELVPLLREVLPSGTWARLPEGRDGVVRLDALDPSSARALWDGVQRRNWVRFEALSPSMRRLARLPVVVALVADMGGPERAVTGLDGVVQAWVEQNTTALGRMLVRHLGLRMWDTPAAVLDEVAIGADAALREALSGKGPLCDALLGLQSAGIVEVDGQLDALEATRLRFPVERVAEWVMARALADRMRGGVPRCGSRTGFREVLDAVAHLPMHLRGLSGALALLHQEGSQSLEGLLSSPDPALRDLGRHAVGAWFDLDADEAQRGLARWADLRAPWCHDLVAVAADAGDEAFLGRALVNGALREAAARSIARITRRDADTAVAGLRLAWAAIRDRYALYPSAAREIGRGLVQVRLAEGQQHLHHPGAVELSAQVARDVLGDRSWLAELRRRTLVAVLGYAVQGYLGTIPPSWPNLERELPAFFRKPAADRERLRPLVDLFAARVSPGEARVASIEAARSGDVGATLLLERALIAAALREQTSGAAFTLVHEVGEAARALRPVPMAAQSVLYVQSSWLFRHAAVRHTPEGQRAWTARADAFRRDIDLWLASAIDPPRRWVSPGGLHIKALFLAAEAGIHELEHGDPVSPLARRLWAQANAGDEALGVDILDDIAIVATTSGRPDLALRLLEPMSSAPGAMEPKVLEVLGAIAARDPEGLEAWLGTLPPALAGLARRVNLAVRDVPPEQSLAINFDEAIVLADGLNREVAGVLEYALRAPSLRALISHVLKVAANRLTGEEVFPEVVTGR
jgi:hypothetical protein